MAESLAGHIKELGLHLPLNRGLSVLAFPGLSQGQVLGLMTDPDDTSLPRPQDWPQAWPVGSCPVLAVW